MLSESASPNWVCRKSLISEICSLHPVSPISSFFSNYWEDWVQLITNLVENYQPVLQVSVLRQWFFCLIIPQIFIEHLILPGGEKDIITPFWEVKNLWGRETSLQWTALRGTMATPGGDTLTHPGEQEKLYDCILKDEQSWPKTQQRIFRRGQAWPSANF